MERLLDDPSRIERAGCAFSILDLDADHQAQAADLADERVALRPVASSPSRSCIAADARRCAVRGLDQPQRGQGRAQATGLPPKVEAWLPLGQSITEARATIAPSGRPLAIPLARQTMSPATPQCSLANILPVRPKPVWTSSSTSRTPCSSQSVPQARAGTPAGDDVAAFALDRLDEDRRQFIGRADRLQAATDAVQIAVARAWWISGTSGAKPVAGAASEPLSDIAP